MANVYIDINASGTDAGTSWANAFDNMTSISTYLTTTASAGDNIWVKGATYTLTASIASVLDGTSALPIVIIGVKAATTNEPPVLTDWAFDTDRPLFACGANNFSFDDYWTVKNLRVTGTANSALRIDIGAKVYNCSVNNSSGTAGRVALNFLTASSMVINCLVECVNGKAFDTTNYNAYVNCFVKDSAVGLESALGLTVLGCVFSGCTIGIDGTVFRDSKLLGNTVYDCTDGIVLSSAVTALTMIGNTISSCTNGVKLDNTGTSLLNLFMDYNNWYNNTRDISVDNGTTEDNSMKGLNALAVDPKFTAPGSDDFTLQSDSLLRNAGMPLFHGVG